MDIPTNAVDAAYTLWLYDNARNRAMYEDMLDPAPGTPRLRTTNPSGTLPDFDELFRPTPEPVDLATAWQAMGPPREHPRLTAARGVDAAAPMRLYRAGSPLVAKAYRADERRVVHVTDGDVTPTPSGARALTVSTLAAQVTADELARLAPSLRARDAGLVRAEIDACREHAATVEPLIASSFAPWVVDLDDQFIAATVAASPERQGSSWL